MKTCDACGEPATVMVEDGTPSKLPLCAACSVEDAAGKGGEWVRFSRLGDPTELLGRNPGGWGCTFGNGTPGECGEPARYGKGDCYGACEAHAAEFGATVKTPMGCDKASVSHPCDGGELAAVTCECGAIYRRCQAHGGEKGARRSIGSHKSALFCPVALHASKKSAVLR